MHKVYENDDLMMYFRKRYCHCCGGALARKRTERVVGKGDPEHRAYCTIGTTYKPYGDILVIGKAYYCTACGQFFSCDEQGEVMEAQKYYHRKVVSKEEIALVQQQNMQSSLKKASKYKWFLLMPVLGALICMIYIFNGRLSQKTEHQDGAKLLFASALLFVGVALVIKIALGFMGDMSFLHHYETVIMLIPSMWSFNIPTLWYMNNQLC